MKTLAITKATCSLADYAKNLQRGALVLTAKGKPIAALVPLENVDLETLSLSTNPQFLDLIERSRRRLEREGGIPEEEIRRRLRLKTRPRRKPKAKGR
jgi:antitoxin (DNA-binding transcriptional repressor) of toxin-antitoxin stability system